ncbi:MAG: hypothetical protein ACFFDT_15305 [Candidatus Hodarchaeota archaeon]
MILRNVNYSLKKSVFLRILLFILLCASSTSSTVAWEHGEHVIQVNDTYVWEVTRCRRENSTRGAYWQFGTTTTAIIELVEGDILNFTITSLEPGGTVNATLQVQNRTYPDFLMGLPYLGAPFNDTDGLVEDQQRISSLKEDIYYFNNSLQNGYYYEEYIRAASKYSYFPASLTRIEAHLATGIRTYYYRNLNPFHNMSSPITVYDEFEIRGLTIPPLLTYDDNTKVYEDDTGQPISWELFLIFLVFCFLASRGHYRRRIR